ncbi:hypothetical protein CDLVIII_1522 [Clostridium sp. DL-VIII]|uniref:hypothetical protein n=1 Tax=Clostridium sp. DL-VIII TaxID=641107 RepID=UPI00023AF1C7|nr:hypothetical protein [Clostridium sp. DL-VIII]EHI98213.1 hypothetical protein CDLVIII_1522 [Clostridium sp. DL-VIII]
MKYNDTISILRSAISILKDPTIISDKFNETLEYFDKLGTNDTMRNKDNTNVNADNSIKYNENEPVKNDYSDRPYDQDTLAYKKQIASSNPQGVIDSIAQELTSARLKQAIILSEIVGKPRSKTRRKRRF